MFLTSSRQYNNSYGGKKTKSYKLKSSTGPSKNSAYVNESRQRGIDPMDRFEVLRTVEMETYTESRHPDEIGYGRDYGMTSPSYTYEHSSPYSGAGTPRSYEQKDGAVVCTAAASDSSATSLTHAVTTDSPFGDKHGV